ncbi:H4MPT-linked C1 transfer pathway protein [Candidatus Bathyarchaeota archaeon A05DMB-2]|nr:H4MPT-linked C1 transfer pathway protein [Candidatus Bathyarchaeota archaeon A05DMB-2]
MVNVIGWDIGGANTKAAFISISNGCVEALKVAVEYYPVWKDPEKLATVLSQLKEKLSGGARLDCAGVTMTAELSDAYQTKREGVTRILEHVARAFADIPVFVLDMDAELRSLSEAKKEPLKVAAANWAATGWLVAQQIANCVVVDVGSTSTSIIPVVGGSVSAVGKNDLEKLMCGELVYTGSLRTNVAAIVDSIPIRRGVARVSSELFAQSGDVHLVLRNITAEEYTVETADSRGKTRAEAMARLARVVCADTEMLTEKEITQMATYIHERQTAQIAGGLRQVYSRAARISGGKVPVVVTGLGRDFLARKAAESIGVEEIVNLGELVGNAGATSASPAVGVALMAAGKIEGVAPRWMP